MADESTWDAVLAEHNELIANTRSFGVPTIVLDGGEGLAIFGPVISELPTDDDGVELWKHVSWLARYENFSELKPRPHDQERPARRALACPPARAPGPG